jgi:prophage regulatory protein
MKKTTVETSITNLNDSLLRLEQVMSLTSLCRSHVFSLIKQGQFPASITIGVRGARWSELEIRQWIATQIVNARKVAMPSVIESSQVPMPSSLTSLEWQ